MGKMTLASDLKFSRRALLAMAAAIPLFGSRRPAIAADVDWAGRGAKIVPDYADPPYDPTGSSIPENALDAADFESVDAWLTAMEAKGRPGKIGSGKYSMGDASPRRLSQSIYGYGKTRPVFEGSSPGWLYLAGSDITIQYCAFRGWKMPIIGKSDWTDWYNLATESWWNHEAFAGPSRGGNDLIHTHDIRDIRILDCEFEQVGVCLVLISDTCRYSNVRFGRNHIAHGMGVVWVAAHKLDHIYCYQNKIRDMNQGDAKGNHVGTIFWLGNNHGEYQFLPEQIALHVDCNECRRVTGSHCYWKVNSAVFADLRSAQHVTINHNILVDMASTVGHSDCNAIYCKCVHAVMRGNLIINCGNDGGTCGPGSEGAHYTLKGSSRGEGEPVAGAAGWDQKIVDAVSVGGQVTGRPLFLVSNKDVVLERVEILDYRGQTDRAGMHAIIRSYDVDGLVMRDITFRNCSAYALYFTTMTDAGDGSVGRHISDWWVVDWRGTDRTPSREPVVVFAKGKVEGWHLTRLETTSGDSLNVVDMTGTRLWPRP